MQIRRAQPTERAALLELWQRSVGATHAFVSDQDRQAMIPQVREYLAGDATEFWVAVDEAGRLMGFMGMCGGNMESLFLAPEFMRRGIGRQLVQHAQSAYGELTTEVNEQNTDARKFYEACGFVVVGRSDFDDQGRPYPLLKMRLAAAR
jgi:putative acetyltransferase